MPRARLRTQSPRWRRKPTDYLRSHYEKHGDEIAAAIPAAFFELNHYERESRTTFRRWKIRFDAENWENNRREDPLSRYSIDGRALLAITATDESIFVTFYPIGKNGAVEAAELAAMTSAQREDYAKEWALARFRWGKFRNRSNCHGVPC